MAIMRGLRGHTSGFAVPTYVLDTPFGKVPLTRDYVLGRAGDHVVMESTRGDLWAEPNPLGDETPALTLPEHRPPRRHRHGPDGRADVRARARGLRRGGVGRAGP